MSSNHTHKDVEPQVLELSRNGGHEFLDIERQSCELVPTKVIEKYPSSSSSRIQSTAKTQKTQETSPDKPLIIYSGTETWLIVILAAVCGIWSSISSPIYLPAIPTIKNKFHTTTERLNLTVTVYSIFQGISPLFWASLSDHFGRRPIFIVCLTMYIGANIGLALSPTYWVLFGLRMLQAFSIASTIAISAATTADVTTRRNRGTYVGVSNGVSLIGNCFGPLIGGGIAARLGWRAIFYFLLIASGTVLVLVLFLFPETNHEIVGDGSIYPKRIANLSPYIIWRSKKYGVPHKNHLHQGNPQSYKSILYKLYIRMKSCILMLFEPDVALVLIPTSIHYTNWFMTQTALSTLLKSNYNFNIDQIGCSYLASGLGGLVSSFTVGKMLSIHYASSVRKYRQKQLDQCLATTTTVDMSQFNIQKTRTDLLPLFSVVSVASTLVFGWTMQYRVHYVVPIIMTFFISLASMAFLTGTVTLVIDLFPNESASANACLNLARCILCAIGLAVLDKMISSMKPGWTFTLIALLCVVSNACLLVVAKIGPRIEKQRRLKNDKSSGGDE